MSSAKVLTDKTKKKKKKFVQEDSSSDEETYPQPASTSYKPPRGYKAIDSDPECPHFDWDKVNKDPNLEIWAIRLPSNLKPKYLDKMSFPLPQQGSMAGPIARITAGKKQTQYDLTVASESTGAEEMKGLSCLLPRKSKDGKLFVAPKPLTGHLVFSECSASPTSPKSSLTTVTPLPMPSSTRYAHPKHLLKHRYIPTSMAGAGGKSRKAAAGDDEDAEMEHTPRTETRPLIDTQSPVRPHKKRKVDADGTEEKKAKKAKREK